MKLVKVTWIDACSYVGQKNVGKNLPVRESLGYLTRDDQFAIGVMYLRDLDQDLKSVAHGADESEGMLIPRNMVINVEIYDKN